VAFGSDDENEDDPGVLQALAEAGTKSFGRPESQSGPDSASRSAGAVSRAGPTTE